MMEVGSRSPTEFMPAITCGRAWTEEEDHAVISKQVFRSQLYHALTAGATGEMWFAYRNADGWNEPGVPLQSAAGEAAAEILELVPSLLSTGSYDPATAMPDVSVNATIQDLNAYEASDWRGSVPVRARVFQESSGC